MPNQFTFEVYFRKEDILSLLENSNDLLVRGGLKYDSLTGNSSLEIIASDVQTGQVQAQEKVGCPMPCSGLDVAGD